jgi:curli biogenesis system outer membrane secretion channel CsgG
MRYLLLSVTAFFLFSCATTIKNFDDYQKSPLLESEFMPTQKALQKSLPSVVVFDFETSNENAKKISATTVIENSLSEILISNKLAEIQDRKNLSKLQNEIRLAEISGKANFSGIKAIDFAVDGNVSNVTFSSEFMKASYNNAGQIIQPERFRYTSTVQGSIKIYELPSLKLVQTINFSGSASKSEEIKRGGINFRGFSVSEKPEAKSFDDTLAKDAVRNAIANAQNNFKSFFAKTGYIMEKRVLEDKTIFLINLGSSDGIKQDDKLQIFQKYSELNPLTGREDAGIRVIGVGIIADKTEDLKTWIVVKDKKTASKIRLGDIVKVTY